MTNDSPGGGESVKDGQPASESGKASRQLVGDGSAPTKTIAPEAEEDSKTRGARRKTKKKGISFWLELPLLFIIALTVAVLIKAFAFQVFRIPSASMYPTLKVGDRVVVNKLTYSAENLHRGDIVVFIDPAQRGVPDRRSFFGKVKDGAVESLGGEGRNKHLIKRVVGCPGQTLEFRAGQLFIDGVRTAEAYLPEGAFTQWDSKTKLGADEFFLMGDNRQNSSDSRVFGAVKEREIVGRAALRIWPFSSAGGLPGGTGTCAPG